MPSSPSADPPADFGRTHRDFVVLVWLTDGPDGWDARGAAYTCDRGERWDFTVPGTRKDSREARDAAVDKARRWIDRWYAARGQ